VLENTEGEKQGLSNKEKKQIRRELKEFARKLDRSQRKAAETEETKAEPLDLHGLIEN
jgi:hypothetical protein